MNEKIRTYLLVGIAAAGMLVSVAYANTLPFVPFEPDKLVGDVNGDKTVNEKDSILLNRYFAGHSVTIEKILADVDNDGTVTRRDAMILSRHCAGWGGYILPKTEK